jgi:hypothetical protein
MRADRWLLFAVASFCVLTGASLWETIVFVPVWASGNPATLTVLRANAGVDSAALWIVLHSLFELVFLGALVSNWKLKSRRNALLMIAVVYLILRVWTGVYFAPAFLNFQRLASMLPPSATLVQSTLRWKHLNYVRTVAVVALNIWMLVYVAFARMPRSLSGAFTPNEAERAK